MQDPGTSEHPGTPLQRVQVVKGWVDGAGEYRVEVFDVGGNADNGASVDLDSCEPDTPKTIQERAWTSPIWYASE